MEAVTKPIIYVDMDDTLCDFMGRWWLKLKDNPVIKFPQSQYGFFTDLEPIKNAVTAMHILNQKYDVWIATRPSVLNPLCYTEKRIWVEKHLGIDFCHKLILTPNKTLLKGDYLIDDVKWEFDGELIQFGTEQYPNWTMVLKYFREKGER